MRDYSCGTQAYPNGRQTSRRKPLQAVAVNARSANVERLRSFRIGKRGTTGKAASENIYLGVDVCCGRPLDHLRRFMVLPVAVPKSRWFSPSPNPPVRSPYFFIAVVLQISQQHPNSVRTIYRIAHVFVF